MPVNPSVQSAPTLLGPPVANPLGGPDNISTNEPTAITMPTVSAPFIPLVDGEEIIDRGNEADFEVIHAYVGPFRRGSRISRKDLGEFADIARLMRHGSLVELCPQMNLIVDPTAATKPPKIK